MDLVDLIFRVGLYAGAAAFAGIALLAPLYMQQARDVRRLREWAQLTPDRGTAEFQAAQAAGVPAPSAAPIPEVTMVARPPVPGIGAGGTAPMPALSPAQRVARDLPGAVRATAERPAIAYRESWWRRFVRRPDPRYLVGIVLGVAVLGVAIGVLTIQLASESPPAAPGQGRTPSVTPSEVDVAVLNATAVPGLAAKVGDDLSAGGFGLGAVTNSPSPEVRSAVMFERGHEQEAQAVARRLGIERVEVIEDDVSRAVARGSRAVGADPAPVVVIAAEDRAGL